MLSTLVTITFCQSTLAPVQIDHGVLNLSGLPAGINFQQVQAIDNRWIGLTSDGKVIGSIAGSEADIIPSNLTFKEIQGTLKSGGGLLDDGRIFWWECNSYPYRSGTSSTEFVSIHDAGTHVMGLTSSGTLEYVGAPEKIAEAPQPPSGESFLDVIGLGGYQYSGVTTDGRLRIWGAGHASAIQDNSGTSWNKIASWGGSALIGINPTGRITVFPTSYPNPFTGQGGFVDIVSRQNAYYAAGRQEDGTVTIYNSSNGYTHSRSFSDIRGGEAIYGVCDIGSQVTANDSSLDSIYPNVDPDQVILLEPGEYEVNSQRMNSSRSCLMRGISKDETTIKLVSSSSEHNLSLENCTVRISSDFYYKSHIHLSNCKVICEDPFKFTKSNVVSISRNSTFIARDCQFEGFASGVLRSSGSSYFTNCTFDSPQIYVGSGSVKVTNSDVSGFDTTSQSCVELDNLDSDFALADFWQTPLSGLLGTLGTVVYCRDNIEGYLRNFDVSNCTSIFGGFSWTDDSTFEIENCTFDQNSAEYGSVFFGQGDTNLTLESSVLTSNQNSHPVFLSNSSAEVINTFFGYNDGCFDVPLSIVRVSDSIFCENNPEFSDQVIDMGSNEFSEDCFDFDCNSNGLIDSDEILTGSAQDCNQNGVPDSCDLDTAFESDCNSNQIPDSCEIADGLLDDCDTDGVPDVCTILDSPSQDSNNDGILDRCQCITDINGDGFTDFSDVLQLLSCWGSDPTGVCGFADVSDDGLIDFSDVLLMLNDFGPC